MVLNLLKTREIQKTLPSIEDGRKRGREARWALGARHVLSFDRSVFYLSEVSPCQSN